MDKNKDQDMLFRAFLSLKTMDEVRMFLIDLCTPKEIEDMAARWQAVQMLEKGISYRQIYEQSGVSTATVTRVARCLSSGTGGYKLLLGRLKSSAPRLKEKT